MIEAIKCAHPGCACMVPKDGSPYGKYCSEHCREAGDEIVEVHCDCKHLACE